jgi:GNAT superfamily N-acetyltransferase
MPEFQLRPMTAADRSEVAELIHVSTNYWYEANRNLRIFGCRPDQVDLFCRVYEDLDPGCCVIAEHSATGRIIGSCFYHPRSTHVSLGIMNAHPSYFGLGVARALLEFIRDFAEREGKPLRLVSSAMNLDSYSLYHRAGFVPYASFQDMLLTVPGDGLPATVPRADRVRNATLEDLPAIVALEQRHLGIEREGDLRYFLENREGIWSVSVLTEDDETVSGYLASVNDPASNMLGPGVCDTESGAAALIRFELNRYPGQTLVWLIPTRCNALAQTLYGWGARNCELHFGQIWGGDADFSGVMMPTFMPETA